MEERNGRCAGRIMSKGLRWDRVALFWPCIIKLRILLSCWSTMSLIRGLLCLILVINVEAIWISRSLTLGRQALSCKRSRLTYRGRRRHMRIALFWIFWRVSRTVSGHWTMHTALYSKRDLMNVLYSLIRIFGSVPPHASIFRIFSLFSARRAKSWIWSLKRRVLSISTPRNFAFDTGLTTSLKRSTQWFSLGFSFFCSGW